MMKIVNRSFLLFFGMVILFPFSCRAFDQWPDTGQTTSYTSTYGEDSDYTINPQSYTKLGYGGAALSDGASAAGGWIMTKDTVTGLIWEVKTDDGSIHDKDDKYSWCDTNSATNGGDQGTCGNGTDTSDFIAAMNAAAFGGFADWRLPTVKELSTLVNSEIPSPGPTINTAFFPNTAAAGYWSSTTYAHSSGSAWLVSFYLGLVNHANKSNSYYVRAVRAGQ